MSAIVAGIGHAVPAQIETNETLEAELQLPKGWIEQRTGVRQRPIASDHEATSDLAIKAGERALEHAERLAGLDRLNVQAVVLATSTPDHLLPPCAPRVAHELGLRGVPAFDLAAACCGFIYALRVAELMVRLDGQPVLVIAANVLSRRVRADDTASRPIFADGAGAVVLMSASSNRGLLRTFLRSDGSRWNELMVPAGGSRIPITAELVSEGAHMMRMTDGKRVFRFAVEAMLQDGQRVLAEAGLTIDDVNWWVPHQANLRIIREVGRRLGIPSERTATILEDYGNSSAATIPIALSVLQQRGALHDDDLVLLTAAGAGFASGACLVRWGQEHG
ncbi:MAG: beta-ketoacyl-ACP synthase 3 [Phycisphaerales bacterium]|nr:beta-ketoacyl-ACP synthase 3 [Phycisphaerales bacterium]